MGEYADMAVDDALNGDWDDDDDEDYGGGWIGSFRRRWRRKRPRKPTNAEVFKNHIPSLEDQGF